MGGYTARPYVQDQAAGIPQSSSALALCWRRLWKTADRAFNRLALDIDGMLANYSAHASKVDVEREIEMQTLILSNAPEAKKPGIALQLARLCVSWR